jgi:glutathione synthase
MPTSVLVIMDPITHIKIAKDSSFAMLLAAQARGWTLHYAELNDLSLSDGIARVGSRSLSVFDDASHWFELGNTEQKPLTDFNVILMRKDPPFDMEYIYSTYLLDQAAEQGCVVVNHPGALRNANEKLATTRFPDLCPPHCVTRDADMLRHFIDTHGDVILKPLDGMGGSSIFRLRADDPNRSVVIETLTQHQTQFTMAQKFIPEITAGDNRVLVIDGEAVPYVLARIPSQGETRGNLAAGGTGVPREINDSERRIVDTVGPWLRENGILFAGLDVIGNYLTEINITSPTCIRELDKAFDLDIAGQLLDNIEQKLAV